MAESKHLIASTMAPSTTHTIVLRLYAEPSPDSDPASARADAVYLDSEGRVLHAERAAEPARLPLPSKTSQVLIALPIQSFSMTVYPGLVANDKQRQQATQYALEEQLLTDVSALQFAFLTLSESDQTLVGMIEKTSLAAYLAPWQASGFEPNVIFPDSELLPQAVATTTVVCTVDNAYVRLPEGGAACVSLHNLPALLLADWGAGLTVPKALNIWSCLAGQDEVSAQGESTDKSDKRVAQALVEQQTSLATRLDENVWQLQWQTEPFDFMAALKTATPAALRQTLNFAVPSHRLREGGQRRRQWRLALSMLIAALVLFGGNQAWSYFTTQRHNTTIEQAIFKVYQQIFPQADQLVAPRIRVQQRLSQLLAAQGKQALWPLLTPVAAVLHANPKVQVSQLAYKAQAIQLSITVERAGWLDRFSSQLRAKALQVKTQTVSTSGKQVRALLLISRSLN